jgi:hypothetical protein
MIPIIIDDLKVKAELIKENKPICYFGQTCKDYIDETYSSKDTGWMHKRSDSDIKGHKNDKS